MVDSKWARDIVTAACLPLKDFMKLWMICILTGHSPVRTYTKATTHHSLLLHLETADLNWKKSDSFFSGLLNTGTESMSQKMLNAPTERSRQDATKDNKSKSTTDNLGSRDATK